MQLALPLDTDERVAAIGRLTGQEWWDRWHLLPEAVRPDDCRAVACPKCGVAAGRNCRHPSGHAGSWSAHTGRWDLALADAEARNPDQAKTRRTRERA